MSSLDPRWEWIETRRLGDPHVTYRKGRCRHLEVERVESGGELVAHLCLTCDQQLPSEWVSPLAEARAKMDRAYRSAARLESQIRQLRRAGASDGDA